MDGALVKGIGIFLSPRREGQLGSKVFRVQPKPERLSAETRIVFVRVGKTCGPIMHLKEALALISPFSDKG